MEEFKKKKKELWDYIDSHKIWVVATGNQTDVTASNMCILSWQEHIYFQTDKRFEKFQNIRENGHIALCFGNYRIKGAAKILGPTTSEENAEIMAAYQQAHPDSYRRYSNKPEGMLIEVVPTEIKIWDYIDGNPYIAYLDLNKQTYVSNLYE
jgi:general stress protein 26